MASRARIANEAWEALYRAQASVARELTAGDVWGDLRPHDYGVLYALSTAPPEGLRITELREDVLLTQPGLSRLIARLEGLNLVERSVDPDDARASRIRLTDDGRAVQRQVGLRHGHHIAQTMTRGLTDDQLVQLRDLCRALGKTTEGLSS
jgi:DNA-binding MarR family transcriptional regulator